MCLQPEQQHRLLSNFGRRKNCFAITYQYSTTCVIKKSGDTSRADSRNEGDPVQFGPGYAQPNNSSTKAIIVIGREPAIHVNLIKRYRELPTLNMFTSLVRHNPLDSYAREEWTTLVRYQCLHDPLSGIIHATYHVVNDHDALDPSI